MGHAGACSKSPNDAPCEMLSLRLNRPISAPLLTLAGAPAPILTAVQGTCTTPDSCPGYLRGTCTTPDSSSVMEIRRRGDTLNLPYCSPNQLIALQAGQRSSCPVVSSSQGLCLCWAAYRADCSYASWVSITHLTRLGT